MGEGGVGLACWFAQRATAFSPSRAVRTLCVGGGAVFDPGLLALRRDPEGSGNPARLPLEHIMSLSSSHSSALASSFRSHSPSLCSASPLSDDQIRAVAPSIFASAAHVCRSERYTYLPTSEVLGALRREGFEPFMVCQTRVRHEDRRGFTKHMVRMRHAGQIDDAEANEIVLVNSHDGTSSYQLLAGMFRYVCSNGLVVGDTVSDGGAPQGADRRARDCRGVFGARGFERVRLHRDGMRAVVLDAAEQGAFATAALSLRYEPDPVRPAPVTASQLLEVRRSADGGADLWSTFNWVHEALVAAAARATCRWSADFQISGTARRGSAGPGECSRRAALDAGMGCGLVPAVARSVGALHRGGADAPPRVEPAWRRSPLRRECHVPCRAIEAQARGQHAPSAHNPRHAFDASITAVRSKRLTASMKPGFRCSIDSGGKVRLIRPSLSMKSCMRP
jgi:hypothetical protein